MCDFGDDGLFGTFPDVNGDGTSDFLDFMIMDDIFLEEERETDPDLFDTDPDE